MSEWSYFRRADGALVGQAVSAPTNLRGKALAEFLAANAPPDCDPVEGHHDHESKRVETVDGKAVVVDHQPPPPSADHEWNETTRRYDKKREAIERERADAAARSALEQLDLAAVRPLLELRLDPTSEVANRKLDEIEAAKAEHRKNILR